MRSYKETLAYLFSLYPNLSKDGWGAYKPGLERVYDLSKILAHPHQSYPVIHIAGTNGKGSVSHILSAVLQQAGYKVGLFTSPHLMDFSERIKINGSAISEDYVIDFVNAYDAPFKVVQPSFFEFTCMMAFAYFKEQKVDIAIVETGLGGRLDCTNIVQPILSVITNIGMDHQKFLGDTLPQIALEKAGIIKKNVPVIVGKKQEECANIFKAAAIKNQSDIQFAEDLAFEMYDCDLKGSYQIENQKTVRAVIAFLQKNDWQIPEQSVVEGIKNAQKLSALFGRWQVLKGQPEIILDTAHNLPGLEQVTQQLLAEKSPFLVVLGFVADKDVAQLLDLFPKQFDYIFTGVSNNARMLKSSELKELALTKGLNGGAIDDPQKVLQKIQSIHSPKKVFIGGSNYLVGELLTYLLK